MAFVGTILAAELEKRMQIIPLETEAQLHDLTTSENPVAIVKHNTACSISQGVLERLQQAGPTTAGLSAVYLLDLLAHRELSNRITSRFGVPHQSPQLLLLRRGRCVYHEWGTDITAEALAAAVGQTTG